MDAQKMLDWLVHFRNPQEIWQNHSSYLICEVLYYVIALLTFSHAWRHGGRFLYLWFATIMHGLTVESISYFVPDIDNFWHAQSMVMLLGKRLPLHIMIFYPCFIYTASVAVSKMHLKKWAEPFAVGLFVVLLDVPFDIMGIKLLWWTWHDTDPNIADRHYWVPWTSYYFHASFACAFTILFHGTRSLLTKTEKYGIASFPVEALCNIITGLFAMPFGVLQFLPIYHPLHDNLKIHTEVCSLLILGFYVVVTWMGDRHPSSGARTNKGDWIDEIGLIVFLHYSLYVLLVVFSKPETIKATGLHEPIGPCNEVSPVQTAFGQILSKKTYLCASNYDEAYFDFKCLTTPPKDGASWYTICGNAFPNYTEYVVVVTAFSCLGFFVYWQILSLSGVYPRKPMHYTTGHVHGQKHKHH
ncbi:uncharacterized protein LOC141904554 [Tubulanus polymorphus]|uniref:uncharacterized protein LOC141904554 n=1 Tax=Tubulanus polymorphus TaxID=672921 RepID=UPI003DA29C43